MKLKNTLAKRLTGKQKEEIINLFTSGMNLEDLSKKFNCTKLTISRNIRKHLGENKYKELFIKSKSDEKFVNNKIINNFKDVNNKDDAYSKGFIKEDFLPVSEFTEIVPLNLDIDNSPQKDLTSISILEVNLPKTVYMIVDKQVELEIKYLKDYPKWHFLSKDELERKTIEIYSDHKIAKSCCQKEQKVIKVPNTNVFKIVAPILNSRGISRIVSSDKLIAL